MHSHAAVHNGVHELYFANWSSQTGVPFNVLQTHLQGGSVAEWLVSVLDSGAEEPGFKSQPRRCRVSLRQTVYTHCAPVHHAAKLVAAVLRIAGVTAGLAESNGSLPPGL